MRWMYITQYGGSEGGLSQKINDTWHSLQILHGWTPGNFHQIRNISLPDCALWDLRKCLIRYIKFNCRAKKDNLQSELRSGGVDSGTGLKHHMMMNTRPDQWKVDQQGVKVDWDWIKNASGKKNADRFLSSLWTSSHVPAELDSEKEWSECSNSSEADWHKPD